MEPVPGAAGVSYLGRVVDLIDLIATSSADGMSLSEVAAACGTPVSTTSRLTRLLEDRGYATRRADKRFVPGPALVMLGFRSLRLFPTEHYRAAIAALGDSTGESVSVGMLFGDEVVLVARHESQHQLRVVATIGSVIAPHRSAMGKAILGHASTARRHEILKRALGVEADRVAEELAKELAAVRSDGFARDEEVFAVGQRCVAAPLLGPDGEAVGAMSVAGPSSRFSREVADSCVNALLEGARRLSVGGPR